MSRVHVLSGGKGVGAASYTVVTASGRSVACETFISAWIMAQLAAVAEADAKALAG